MPAARIPRARQRLCETKYGVFLEESACRDATHARTRPRPLHRVGNQGRSVRETATALGSLLAPDQPGPHS